MTCPHGLDRDQIDCLQCEDEERAHRAVPVPADELRALREDAARLDYLEAEANREPIVLHAKPALKGGYRGIGLSNINRTLRQAIDDMRGSADAERMAAGFAEALALTEEAVSGGWIDAAQQLPDDDLCVLIALDDGEVWTGYCDAGSWLSAAGEPMAAKVTDWQHMPAHPRAGLKRLPDGEALSKTVLTVADGWPFPSFKP